MPTRKLVLVKGDGSLFRGYLYTPLYSARVPGVPGGGQTPVKKRAIRAICAGKVADSHSQSYFVSDGTSTAAWRKIASHRAWAAAEAKMEQWP